MNQWKLYYIEATSPEELHSPYVQYLVNKLILSCSLCLKCVPTDATEFYINPHPKRAGRLEKMSVIKRKRLNLAIGIKSTPSELPFAVNIEQ